MPTYQYRCTECGNELEAVQRFTDSSLTDCPACEGQLRKVFNAVGVVFKGSGFYRTDSRADAKKSGAKADGSDAGSTSGDKSSGEKGSGEKGSTEKKSSDSSSTEKSASKQPVAAGSSSGSGGGSNSGKGSSTAA